MNLSSFDVVRKLKKFFSINKIGHAGTLDPLATGILPIAFGNATKTIPYLVTSKKKYRFTILWGIKTSSHDLEGEIIEKSDAILVGKNTVQQDDPLLTVRYAKGKNPTRIILDSHGTIKNERTDIY